MNADDSIVFVVDDDPSIRKSLERLLRTAGYSTETFGSVTDFLSRKHHSGAGCLVLDVRCPKYRVWRRGRSSRRRVTTCPRCLSAGTPMFAPAFAR